MPDKVELSKKAMKELRALPSYIATKLKSWVELVEARGLLEARKIPGYHDEPLKGERVGQRSIRLSKAYRAIYVVTKSGAFQIVFIETVNKHEY